MKLKFSLILVLVYWSSLAFPQESKITISGKVSYASNPSYLFYSFQVSVNDTLVKLSKANQKNFDAAIKIGKKDTTKLKAAFALMRANENAFNALAKDTSVYVTTKRDGLFKFSAYDTDSLYFKSPYCVTQKYAVADLMKLDSVVIKMIPEQCVPNEKWEGQNPKLYVVIAEKIAVKDADVFYCNPILDGRYEAKYKIIKNIYGNLDKDTVEFVAFDHYQFPPFAEFKYVLLFLNEYAGKFYHEKYQYFDVYPTKNGRWARPGNPYALDLNDNDSTVKAVPIEFKKNVVFKRYDYFPFEIKQKFTLPYFKYLGNDIIPLSGGLFRRPA